MRCVHDVGVECGGSWGVGFFDGVVGSTDASSVLGFLVRSSSQPSNGFSDMSYWYDKVEVEDRLLVSTSICVDGVGSTGASSELGFLVGSSSQPSNGLPDMSTRYSELEDDGEGEGAVERDTCSSDAIVKTWRDTIEDAASRKTLNEGKWESQG
jgi:hypothetical protein